MDGHRAVPARRPGEPVLSSGADCYRVEEGADVDLGGIATRDDALFDGDKDEGVERLWALADEIAGLQERLFAEGRRALLIVLQGMDTAGKSSTVRDVFRATNALGVRAVSFGVPTSEERDHDYLWRIHAHTPERGTITVFDRSHYEDVTVVRVKDLVDRDVWSRRFGQIRDFEQRLHEEGTEVVKVFLHISPEEQAEQLTERLDDPTKHWKLSASDFTDRPLWPDYQAAWSEAIARTSTETCPWYVIPADRRWYRKLAVATLVRDTLERLDPSYPDPDPDLDLDALRRELGRDPG